MTRARLAATTLAATVFALLVAAPGAAAHPLGNFSINHLTQVKVSSDRIELRYILDQAEIPTFQERGLEPGEVLARKRAEVGRRLRLTVDGRPVALRFEPHAAISFPPGQGGLKLTRVEFPLSATVERPRAVRLRDDSFPGRVGWKAIVARPGRHTTVRTDAPATDPTNGLRTYPKDLLSSPLDERTASFSVRPGDGKLIAPRSEGGAAVTTTNNRSGDGFAGVFEDAASGKGVLLLLLLAAFGWGALHALSPGHGKGMVAAYLVGTRGTARHALALGATVTFTHTIGVFLLGVVTLALSQYVLPEDLYPWLNLAAGLLVVTVGLGVLRSRLRWARGGAGGHDHRHAEHDDEHHAHDHEHVHHQIPDRVTWRGLLGMGVAAGLIPCPSALVVLLGAIAQHQIALGLLLIVAFSVGLATTLTSLGLVVVYARRLTARLPAPGRLAAALPALSAILIVGVGFVLTAHAIPQVA